MEISKEEFLKQFGDDYGYPNSPKNIDEIRATEFKRLEGLVYLDHAGATLYSETQMESVAKDLTSNLYGNPHSQNDSSIATSDMISAARQKVLAYLNASPKEYKCIFTSGATAALKLIGECFPWSRESYYVYTMENHNSVLGIREYALDRGATSVAVDIEEVQDCGDQYETTGSSIRIQRHSVLQRTNASSQGLADIHPSGNAYNLFAFPSECNFSGVKYPLDLVKIIKEDGGKKLGGSSHSRGRWLILIDAAKGCSTEPPDLARYPADFVVFSFYKIFGYPTGLGALVVRTEAARILNKKYFSGGTVSASIADVDLVNRRESIEQLLEDGTLPFLSIASIRHGFKIIDSLTISSIARHTASLATYVRNAIVSLKHENGSDLCTLYGSNMTKVLPPDLGPTIAFNLKRDDGSWFGYREVEKLASLSGFWDPVAGCFCNPGACAKNLGLSHSELLSNIEAGHVCWDDNDILNGKPTGAVRVSFGYMSTFEDAEKFLKFVVSSFVTKPNLSRDAYPFETQSLTGSQFVGGVHLKSITIYPVKSCAGFSVQSWPLSNTGLLYDREWLLKGPNGEILTQKKVPEMCHIRTFIDLQKEKFYLESPRSKTKLQISLQKNSLCRLKEEMDVYGQRYDVQNYENEVNMWFTEATGRPCTFVRCLGLKSQHCSSKGGREGTREGLCRELRTNLNFSNEAQVLLISENSVNDLNCRLNNQKGNCRSEQQSVVDAMRFRPNLVVSGAEPFAEDNWISVHIGKAHFISLGGCNRCEMINIGQQSGQKLKPREPLRTLASYRRVQGKILFGILLRYESTTISEDGEVPRIGEEQRLRVGQEVYPSMN
ncbi:molybdenum cofactor sulfurase isoform X2 [Asparagus officinalis]|uniref:molybdenum cofactor sulfurase isoform X2 n=1 Tax=Asparagus officinalis TaxID=4686 RepID=UPI00098DE3D2|nr:molybdenum cofactor sulfurase isoform X2 [Asparagus officinalis]